MSGGMRVLLYILSFFIPVAGIIVGIIWLNDSDEEKKEIGKVCLIIGIASMLIGCLCWFAATFIPLLFGM
jgi:uncharacterized membrane protein HdeD (DUF308 family)